MSENKIGTLTDNHVVSLDYTLRLNNGQVVDSSEGREPLEFIQGQGQIIPGLEKELYGMAINDEKKVIIPPGDAYGELEPDNFEWVERDAFPADMELTEGMGLRMRDSNTDQVMEAYVAEIGPEGVKLDFNHPLAGETLHFEVKITGLRDATSEELAHGHVHGPDGHHH